MKGNIKLFFHARLQGSIKYNATCSTFYTNRSISIEHGEVCASQHMNHKGFQLHRSFSKGKSLEQAWSFDKTDLSLLSREHIQKLCFGCAPYLNWSRMMGIINLVALIK